MRHIRPIELHLYARSFPDAAKALAASFQPDASLIPEADATPVVFMHRHTLKLFLKGIVPGEGAVFS